MLFGSLCAFAPVVAPVAVPLTPGVAAPLVVAPVVGAAPVPGAPSSTGAASCVPVLEQPASNTMTNAPMIHLRMNCLLD
jgi:hypothetical protein